MKNNVLIKDGNRILLFLLIFIMFSSGIHQIQIKFNFNSNLPLEAANHSEILLDGNTALANFCSGNGTFGTYASPFVIKDYNIDAAGSGNCIEIDDTNLYVIISNCTLINATVSTQTTGAGIWLSNCTNIQVTNCNLTNDCYGVYLTQSANNTVINNIILGMYASIGVYLHNSSQNIIQLNNINENFDLASGITLMNSAVNNSILDNYFDQPTTGIHLTTNANATIRNNTFYYPNSFTIWAEQSPGACLIINNTIITSGITGVEIDSLTKVSEIEDNYFYGCYPWAISLHSSSNITIMNNTMIYGTGSIMLDNASSCIISQCVSKDTNGFQDYRITDGSEYNNFTQNTILQNTGNYPLITLDSHSDYNNFNQNVLEFGKNMSIYSDHCNYTQFIQNTFINTTVGIQLTASNNTNSYLNTFVNNHLSQANVTNSVGSVWDNGTIGNYWSDYQTRYPSATNNGLVWSTPYQINGSSSYDNHPIVQCGIITTLNINHPADIQYFYGNSGNKIPWIISSSLISTPNYYIYQNGTSVKNGSWVNATDIGFNIDGLAAGSYNYSIFVTDGFGIILQDDVIVTVLQLEVPQFTHPSDQTFTEGTSPHSIEWVVTCPTVNGSSDYDVYWNVTNIAETGGVWSSGIIIDIDISYFAAGTYNFTIIAFNGYNGTAQDEVDVSVLSNYAPQLYNVNDLYVAENQININASWVITDDGVQNPTYEVFKEGVLYDSNVWVSGENITENTTGWAIGDYSFEMDAYDGIGLSNTTTINVHVIPNHIPQPSPSSDIQFIAGSSGNILSWLVTDPDINPNASYIIYANNSLYNSGEWSSGQSITDNFDTLSPGSHNITLIVDDGIGGINQTTTIVTVIDHIPQLSQSNDIQFTSGAKGNVLSWTVTDPDINPNASYTIYANGNILNSGVWISGQSITQNVDSLAVGTYNITLVVNDGFGGINQTTTIVTVNVATTTPNSSSTGSSTSSNTLIGTTSTPAIGGFNSYSIVIVIGIGMIAIIMVFVFVRRKRTRTQPKN